MSSRFSHVIVSIKIPFPVSVQFSSVAQSCPTLCDPMNRSRPGLPVHHQLLEYTKTHVHWVGDAIHTLTPSMPFWCYMHMLLFGNKEATWPLEGPQSNMVIKSLGSWRQFICPLRYQSPIVLQWDTKKGPQKWHEGTNQLTRQLREQHFRTSIVLTRWTFVDKVMSLLFIFLFLWKCEYFLWIMLLWMFMYKFLCGHIFSFFFDIHLGVKWLAYMATLF